MRKVGAVGYRGQMSDKQFRFQDLEIWRCRAKMSGKLFQPVVTSPWDYYRAKTLRTPSSESFFP